MLVYTPTSFSATFNVRENVQRLSRGKAENTAVYAAISSASLSLLATAVDAVFDIGANVLLFWLHRKAVQLDTNEWPVGGARLETIGNVIYGVYDIPSTRS
jgi:hypothetical protein